MQQVLQCSYCEKCTFLSFTGIHICPNANGVTGVTDRTTAYQICSELGCSDHKFNCNKFINIGEILSCFSKCKSCLMDLMRVRFPEKEWVYDIDPSLYDWFVKTLTQYKWDLTDDKHEFDDKNEFDEFVLEELIDTLLQRKEFGQVETAVLTFLRSQGAHVGNGYEWIDDMAGKGVTFIKALCQAYGPELDLQKYKLGSLFCITCLNGYCETARWLVTEYKDNIEISGTILEPSSNRCIPLAPESIFNGGYWIKINSSSELLDYVMKCPLTKPRLKEILDILKEHFPEAFIVLNTPSVGQQNGISILTYDYGPAVHACDIRTYDLKLAVYATGRISIDLVGYCTNTNNYLGDKLLTSKITWRKFVARDMVTKADFLPADMKNAIFIPWEETGLTVYYGDTGRPKFETYIVVTRGDTPIYIYHERDLCLQPKDVMYGYSSDNHMLIENWGDGGSQVFITYNPAA